MYVMRPSPPSSSGSVQTPGWLEVRCGENERSKKKEGEFFVFFFLFLYKKKLNVLSIDPEMSTTQTMSAGRLPFALRPSGVG